MAARKHGSRTRPPATDVLDAGTGPLEVTGLAAHPRRPGRVVVEVNGVAVGVLAIDQVAEMSLRTGASIPQGAVRAVGRALRRAALLDRALDLLATRARSTRDLQLRLQRLDAAADDIGWVMERLTAQGYLDDASYARQVARARIVSGGASRRRVVSELRRRGIDPGIAAEAVEEVLGDVQLDEYGGALAAARKRLRALGSVAPPVRRRRLYSFLARRGYDPEAIARALKAVLGDDAGSE